MNKEEREQLKNEIKQELMLAIPDMVGNLMAQTAALTKINKDFYAKYTEFKDYQVVVARMVEEVDAKNPLKDYNTKLEMAVPKIREVINRMNGLDRTTVTKPKLNYNGEI